MSENDRWLALLRPEGPVMSNRESLAEEIDKGAAYVAAMEAVAQASNLIEATPLRDHMTTTAALMAYRANEKLCRRLDEIIYLMKHGI